MTIIEQNIHSSDPSQSYNIFSSTAHDKTKEKSTEDFECNLLKTCQKGKANFKDPIGENERNTGYFKQLSAFIFTCPRRKLDFDPLFASTQVYQENNIVDNNQLSVNQIF